VPVISARYAQNADKLQGYDWSALFGTNNPASGTLLDARIGDGSIAASKLTPGTITAVQIASNTITSGQVANGTITSNQIADAAITSAKLSADLVLDSIVPPGTIVAFGGDQVPLGWLLCGGDVKSSLQYPRLYSAIRTNWGAGILGSTNDFNLPDLRGMFLRGVNSGRNDGYDDPDAGGRTNSVPVGRPATGGQVSGNNGDSVGSIQSDAFAQHTHALSWTGHPLAADVINADWPPGFSGSGLFANISSLKSPTAFSAGNTGGDETRSKNAYVNYIIKY
jgi:hypothetical protein